LLLPLKALRTSLFRL